MTNEEIGRLLLGILHRSEGIERTSGQRFDVIEQRPNAIESRLADTATQEMLFTGETRLLTEFHNRASPSEQKPRTHREALRALDLQIEETAGRVPKLEAAQDLRH